MDICTSYLHAATNEHANARAWRTPAENNSHVLNYIGIQQLVYTGDITSYMSNQMKYLIVLECR